MKGKSTTSMRSVKNFRDDDDDDDEEELEVKKIMDLDDFIALGCTKFVCPYNVIVRKDIQKDDHLTKLLKPETKKKAVPQNIKINTSDTDKTEETTSKENVQAVDEDTLIITALYDNNNRLVELHFQELLDIPRVVMQIVGLIMPKYPALTKVTIKKCKLNKYTIYELGRVLNFTSITDICLDGSTLPEANFAFLLQNSRIQSLSLARCSINDVVCEAIASELHFLQPAETYLVTLNLSSNRITDEGAKYLGLALRTNRHLRYLNLSGNGLSDVGANYIIQTLMCFPMSHEEIIAKRERYMKYVKAKNDIIMKYLTGFETKSLESPSSMGTSRRIKHQQREATYSPYKPPTKQTRRSIGSSKTNRFDDLAYMRAENLACELVGPLIDPFHNNFLKLINGYNYCAGNMVLCYLNLAYNNISLMSVKKLLALVKYQSMTKKLSQHGLLRVVIEGNNLPSTCSETDLLFDYLNRNIVCFSPKFKTNDTKAGRARGRSRISVIPEILPQLTNKS